MSNKNSKKKEISQQDVHEGEFVEKASKYINASLTEEVMVLKAQLLTEYYINSLLVCILEPDEGHFFSSERVRFSDKIKKLRELKIFRSAEMEAIQRLNRLRNRFGHDINYQVTESDLDYLGFCFGKKYLGDKYKLDKNGKKISMKNNLHTLLLKTCVIVAVELAGRLPDDKKE